MWLFREIITIRGTKMFQGAMRCDGVFESGRFAARVPFPKSEVLLIENLNTTITVWIQNMKMVLNLRLRHVVVVFLPAGIIQIRFREIKSSKLPR